MRFAICSFLFIACASAPAPETVAPAPVGPECPPAPESQPCPTCPECPKPAPEPVAASWYCTERTKSNGVKYGHCYISERVCEIYRKEIQAKKYGTTTPCTSQESAYCFEDGDTVLQSRQIQCGRTREDCEAFRKYSMEHPLSENTRHSTCELRRNTDSYTYDDAGKRVLYEP